MLSMFRGRSEKQQAESAMLFNRLCDVVHGLAFKLYPIFVESVHLHLGKRFKERRKQ